MYFHDYEKMSLVSDENTQSVLKFKDPCVVQNSLYGSFTTVFPFNNILPPSPSVNSPGRLCFASTSSSSSAQTVGIYSPVFLQESVG